MTPDDEIKRLRTEVAQLKSNLANRRPDPILLPPSVQFMVVTTTLPAATGTTTLTIGQTGRARAAKYNATAHTLTADTSAPIVMVLNDHNKTFVAGAFIKVCSAFGQLWAFDINDCTKFV